MIQVPSTLQADRGCAAVASFFWGEGGLLAKKGVTLRGLRITEKKEILRKPIVSVLIETVSCVPYNIAILPYYCNTVPYYENSIAKYHITVTHL